MSAPAAINIAAAAAASTASASDLSSVSDSPLLAANLSDILGTTAAQIESSRQLLSSICYAEKHSHDYCEFLGFLGDVAGGLRQDGDRLTDSDSDSDSEFDGAGNSRRHGGNGILNYSQLWEATPTDLREAAGLPQLMGLRNGDVIQTDEYRGIGRHFVLWLACPPQEKPIVWHSEEAVAAFIRLAKKASQEHETEIASFASRKAMDVDESELGEDEDSEEEPADSESYEMPVLVAREADDPLRPDYHCYFFSNRQAECDEYGYSPAYAVSNASSRYYDAHNHDCGIRVIDPCLTHPLSQYGKVISEAKSSPRFQNDENFPYQYVGYFDDDCEVFEWTRLRLTQNQKTGETEADAEMEEGEERELEQEQEQQEEEENSHGYNVAHIRLTRLLFAQHFAYIRLRQKTLSDAQSQVLIKDVANITASYVAVAP